MHGLTRGFVGGLCLVFLGAPLLADEEQEREGQAADAREEEAATTQEEPFLTREEVLYVEDTASPIATSNRTATKMSLPILETPASVSVVSGPLFREQGSTILGEALRNVPGVNPQTQFGVHDLFYIRGFESLSGGLVLVDGAAEPEATFYQLYNVDSIEVVRGPGGFLYGGNPLSGTVNLLRKSPLRDWSLGGGLTLGSWETYRGTFDLNLGRGGGPLSLRVNGMWDESDHYRDRKESQSAGLNPALTWWIGDESNLRVNLEYLRNDYSPDAGLPVARDRSFEVPRTTAYETELDFSDQDLYRFRIDYESMLSRSVLLRNKTYFTELDWQSKGTLLLGVVPGAGGPSVLRGMNLLDNDDEFLGNQLEAVFSKGRHELVAGIELFSGNNDFLLDFGFLPPVALFDPVDPGVPPLLVPSLREMGDAETRIVAPYLLDRFEVSNRVELLLGARFDSISFDNDATGTSRDDEEVSPILGVVFQPTPTTSLYANLSRGFAPPSSRVVEDQEPEESEQVEVGLKADLAGGKLHSALALYHLERENIPIFDPNGFTAQQGTQRSRGVELELSGSPLDDFRYHVSYAYTDSELTEFTERIVQPVFTVLDRSGNRPPFAPEHLVNVWLVKSVGSRLSLGGGARYVDDQFIAADNVFRIDDAILLEAMVSYDFARWGVNLNLENITDEEYDTRGFGSTSIIPGDPARVYVSLEFRN